MSHVINEVFVFVMDNPEGEGVPGIQIPDPHNFGMTIFMPGVCADRARLVSIMPVMKVIARQTGCDLKLIRLTHREDVSHMLAEAGR